MSVWFTIVLEQSLQNLTFDSPPHLRLFICTDTHFGSRMVPREDCGSNSSFVYLPWSQWSFTITDEFGPFKQSSAVVTRGTRNHPKGIPIPTVKQQIRQTDGATDRQEQTGFALRRRNGERFHGWARSDTVLEKNLERNFRDSEASGN